MVGRVKRFVNIGCNNKPSSSPLHAGGGLVHGLGDELDDLGEGDGAELSVVLLEVGQVLVQLLLAHARQVVLSAAAAH